MNTSDDVWLCILLVALYGLLLYLWRKFTHASRGQVTAVVLVATIVFFLICNAFPGAKHSAALPFGEAQASELKR
jgi:hypothetical protein